ncbi:MAG: nitronate monooxygenase [bacterium]|nr:nitronate monooxygenase [bacterium]
MLKTRITEMLGIKYPIIAGTMMNVSKPEFVAACSNAGGLGILASAIYKTPESLREGIRETASLTDKPFAVNVNLFPALQPVNMEEFVQAMLDEGVTIFETSGHVAPENLVPFFKREGITWIHKCAGVRYAKKGARLGADIVEVVGWENGGATGPLDIGSLVLTPSTVDALDVPVISGGGVADGRGLAAILALGAEGVIIGTRIMATVECPIHDNLKNALLSAAHTDTTLIMQSLNSTHRVWNNKAAQVIRDLEAAHREPNEIFNAAAGSKVRKLYETGDLDAGVTSCGQAIGMVTDVPTVQELFDRMMDEAEAVSNRLSAMKS